MLIDSIRSVVGTVRVLLDTRLVLFIQHDKHILFVDRLLCDTQMGIIAAILLCSELVTRSKNESALNVDHQPCIKKTGMHPEMLRKRSAGKKLRRSPGKKLRHSL